jgi:uncharacterized membrane protein
MNNSNTRNNVIKPIALGAVVAAVYVVLTAALLAPLSFGAVQLRVAEVLTLLCFYNKKFIPALIVGTFLANMTSPLGWIDWVVGTSATAFAVTLMSFVKNIWIAAIFPVVINAVLVGTMLTYWTGLATTYWADEGIPIDPLHFNIGFVGLGQFVVIMIVGVPLFKFGIERNQKFMEMIKS